MHFRGLHYGYIIYVPLEKIKIAKDE